MIQESGSYTADQVRGIWIIYGRPGYRNLRHIRQTMIQESETYVRQYWIQGITVTLVMDVRES